jgi:hypothetical protein
MKNTKTHYMIVNSAQTEAMSMDGCMSSLSFPCITSTKQEAQKVIDKWTQKRLKSGRSPYKLLIKEVD